MLPRVLVIWIISMIPDDILDRMRLKIMFTKVNPIYNCADFIKISLVVDNQFLP